MMTTYVKNADGSATVTYPSGIVGQFADADQFLCEVANGHLFPYRLGALDCVQLDACVARHPAGKKIGR